MTPFGDAFACAFVRVCVCFCVVFLCNNPRLRERNGLSGKHVRVGDLLQDALKAHLSLDGVLAKSLDGPVLNLVTDSLPRCKSRDLGLLVENGLGLGVLGVGRVGAGLKHKQQVVHGHVCGPHDHSSGLGVNLGHLSHIRHVGASNESEEPLGDALLAGDESLSSEDTRRRVNFSSENVNGNDMGGNLVGVLLPVGDGDLFPRVVEVVSGVEEFHFCVGFVVSVKVTLCRLGRLTSIYWEKSAFQISLWESFFSSNSI